MPVALAEIGAVLEQQPLGGYMQQPAQQSEIRVNPVPFARRQDMETAAIVNQAIVFQERLGVEYAAAYLSCRGVNVDVAMRVLTRPWERRRM